MSALFNENNKERRNVAEAAGVKHQDSRPVFLFCFGLTFLGILANVISVVSPIVGFTTAHYQLIEIERKV